MTKLGKVSIGLVAALAMTLTMGAKDKKKVMASAPGILQPQMVVEGGSYEKPMGSIGTKPDSAWTATTMGASVDGKPNMAKIVTMTGEIVDFSCYLQIGKHGEKHRSCGQKCFKNGQPIGLLTKDGNLYMLMEEEHDLRRDGMTDFRSAAVEHTAHIMEVTGTMSEQAGMKAIYVQGYLKK